MDRAQALALLKDRFGHGHFRGAQEQAIEGLLNRRECVRELRSDAGTLIPRDVVPQQVHFALQRLLRRRDRNGKVSVLS